MERGGFIYIMTNKNNSTLYIGVTSHLVSRVAEHRKLLNKRSFTGRYNLNKLVYFEIFPTIEEAIFREKQLKAGSRKKKDELINAVNPEFLDLYSQILLDNYEITSSLRSS